MLGRAVQEFSIDEEAPFASVLGKPLYVSAFRLFDKKGDARNFSSILSAEVKDSVWSEIFELKRKFFDLVKPEVVQHYVKHPFNFDSRYERYKNGLILPAYDITPHSKARTIYIERKEAELEGGDSEDSTNTK